MFAGLAGHSILSLKAPATAGYGLMLGVLAHLVGWPGPRSLTADRRCPGRGAREARRTWWSATGASSRSPSCHRPMQSCSTSRRARCWRSPSDAVPDRYRRALTRFRYGPGVFKLDWALDGPIPWANADCARAATVHLGGTLGEIARRSPTCRPDGIPERPYVLLAQQSLFDPTRARGHAGRVGVLPRPQRFDGRHDRPDRAADRAVRSRFRDRILARHAMNTKAVEAHDADYIGGDINGGVADLRQFVRRPTLGLHPWKTPIDGCLLVFEFDPTRRWCARDVRMACRPGSVERLRDGRRIE